MIASYPKVVSCGHRMLEPLKGKPVYVQEKVDGSQFSFELVDGEVKFRSRGGEIHLDAVQKLFRPAVDHVLSRKGDLVEGRVFRGEAVCSPRHNTLAYNRTPQGFIALFDVEYEMAPAFHTAMQSWASLLEVEPVPLLGTYPTYEAALADSERLLDRESFLGGCKIEGFVIKPVEPVFGVDGKPLVAKVVSDDFKEKHRVNWKSDNPQKKDVVDALATAMCTEARWQKAIQRLRETDDLVNAPQDIGKLIREVQADIESECEDDIKEALYKWALPHIKRKAVAGLPEWYKALVAA